MSLRPISLHPFSIHAPILSPHIHTVSFLRPRVFSMQSQHRRILQLEAEVEALRVDAGRQQEVLMKQRAQTRAAEATVQELQQELENNAGR